MSDNELNKPAPVRINAPSRTRLINRLFRLLERQIGQLENEEMTTMGDKEVAVLGSMIRSLEKLVELDNEEKARKPGRKPARNIEELREKLAERIDRLKRG